ncbi:MAG: tetratricopeptide repeat protein, partial [Anaerolineaceae bacterium]
QTYRNFRGNINYMRDFNDPLIISFPSGGTCAHIIDSSRPELSLNDEPIIYRIASFSQIDQIITNTESHTPPIEIFGAEPEHGWCYYYQKVSLARQQGDWQSAAALGDEALAAELAPQDLSEWVLFIETYLEAGQPDKASRLADQIKNSKTTAENLCAEWKYEQPHVNVEVMDLVCNEIK